MDVYLVLSQVLRSLYERSDRCPGEGPQEVFRVDWKERQNNQYGGGVCCQLILFGIEYLDEIMMTEKYKQ